MMVFNQVVFSNSRNRIKVMAFAFSTLLLSPVVWAQNITQNSVIQYANNMNQAANAKSIARVSKLVADDAIISISRRGKTTNLDKSAYLNLLQSSWSDTQNYRYDITLNNVVISGANAKADVKTIETYQVDGKETTLTTTSRATLTSDGSDNALLLRSVSQVTID